MQTSKPRRKHFSRTEQRAMVLMWRQSGQSTEAFTREHDIRPHTFARWQRDSAVKEPHHQGSAFLPVQIAAADAPTRNPSPPPRYVARVKVGAYHAEILAGAHPADVRAVLTALRGAMT